MSLSGEGQRPERNWSAWEESAMRDELDLLWFDYAEHFIAIQQSDNDSKPQEILLGGVVESESSGPIDIWFTILRAKDGDTMTIGAEHQRYEITDDDIALIRDRAQSLSEDDIRQVRQWASGYAVKWNKEKSIEIAEKLRLSGKLPQLDTKLTWSWLGL